MKGYRVQGASLDHALWFHRPFRADEWLLFSKESPVTARGRGFVRGHVFNQQGELVASASQECLIRLRSRPHLRPDRRVDSLGDSEVPNPIGPASEAASHDPGVAPALESVIVSVGPETTWRKGR